jgi:hypothetical protein
MFFERLSPGSNPEQRSDEGRLPSRVTPCSPFDLSLPQHVHRFNAFQSSLCCVKALEAL